MASKHILLIVGGGIAAYKACELVRLIRKAGMTVRCVLTKGGQEFITPMTLAALSENQVFTHLFDLKDEAEMGHIQLSREADLVVICPATADLLAKMQAGLADDLATTLLLATDKKVLAAPAMNVRMWNHVATRRNVASLRADGVHVMEPDEGDMACGEYGPGRLPEPERILAEIRAMLHMGGEQTRPLTGRHVLITAGPTFEAIDPVRYIANRSSGRQGFAIAQAAAEMGAEVTLIAGPVHLTTPAGVTRIDVESAREMQAAVENALPADIAIMAAAVADWRPEEVSGQKIKKNGTAPAPLSVAENPDILASLSRHKNRPSLVIGFAAETENIAEYARAKLEKKGCDWIVANDVSGDVMGGENNAFHIVTAQADEIWPQSPKTVIARKLMEKIANEFAG